MNEGKAIQLAKVAADEVGYPWDSTDVVATRHRALLVFPVWRVTSALPEGNYIVRATIPDGAAHASRLEMLSTRRALPDVIRISVTRVLVQAILICTVTFAAIRHIIPSTLPRDAAIAAAFTLLCGFVIERYSAQRAFRRELHNNRDA